MARLRSQQRQVAAGDAGRHQEGARLDPVGNDTVARGVQARHAGDDHLAMPDPFDARAHGDEALGEIDDLRLAGRPHQTGVALGQGRGHQHVFSRADRDLGEDVLAAAQALWCPRLDVAVLKDDLGAQRLHSAQVQIDGPGSDGAAPR